MMEKNKAYITYLILFLFLMSVYVAYFEPFGLHDEISLVLFSSGVLLSGLSKNPDVHKLFSTTIAVLLLTYFWLSKNYTEILFCTVITLIGIIFNNHLYTLYIRHLRAAMSLSKERKNSKRLLMFREKEVRRSYIQKLETMTALSKIGTLTTGLLHDITQPIQALSLTMDSLYVSSQDQTLSQSNMLAALESAQAKKKVIHSYIKAVLSHIQPTQSITQFKISSVLDDVLILYSYDMRHHKIDLHTNIEDNLELYGDSFSFTRVLSNIVGNAVDALKKSSIEKKSILITAHIDMNVLTMTIKDNGPGIPKNIQSKIFSLNSSSKSKNEHYGMGLYISKKIIQTNFNGTLTLQTSNSNGTAFQIVIPIFE